LIARARLAALALAALAMLGVGAVSAGADPGPTRVGVRGKEFTLLLSRLKVEPGDAIVQFVNAGEDPHDLSIQRIGDPELYSVPELPPGEVGEVGLYLRRKSSYRLWCSLPNHRELGMEATLRVGKRKPG
jgi:plastocyanin